MSLALFLAALAQSAPAAAPLPAASPTPAEKPVCRREATTGSFLPGKRTCRTRAEWAAIDAANADAAQARRRATAGTPRRD